MISRIIGREPAEKEEAAYQVAKQAWLGIGGTGVIPSSWMFPLFCALKAMDAEPVEDDPAEIIEPKVHAPRQPYRDIKNRINSNFQGSTMEQCEDLNEGDPVMIWRQTHSSAHPARFRNISDSGRVVVSVEYSETPVSFLPHNVHIPNSRLPSMEELTPAYGNGTFSD